MTVGISLMVLTPPLKLGGGVLYKCLRYIGDFVHGDLGLLPSLVSLLDDILLLRKPSSIGDGLQIKLSSDDLRWACLFSSNA